MASFTFVQSGHSTDVEATIDDSGVWMDATAIKQAIGWELKPQGLCQLDVCIPVSRHPGLVQDGAVELSKLAEILNRPLAIATGEQAAYLAPPQMHVNQTHPTRNAPDFQLPDLDGVHHSLSEHRGSKVLLIAWASW